MSKRLLIVALSLASTGTSVAAPTPAWCKDHKFSGDPYLATLKSDNPGNVLETLAHAVCLPSPESESNRAAIEQSRQAWGKRLGMQEADWADVIAFAKERGPQATFSTKIVTEYTPIDQYNAIVEGFDRPGGVGPLRDAMYATDVFDGKLSEVGRFGYISRCMGTVGVGSPGPVEWAICAGDIAAFDAAKFFDQVRRDTAHDGAYKMQLRLAALSLADDIKKHAAKVQAAWKEDPAYKRMFDIAAAARDEWARTMGKETALLELVASAESAHFSGSRSALATCAERSSAGLAEQVGKVPAKTFANMFDERFDPTKGAGWKMAPVLVGNTAVNLAASAYALCNADGISDYLAAALSATPGMRGPRTLGFTRLLTEKIQLDDVNARLSFPSYDRPYDRPGGALMTSGGVVASTVPDGELVTVKFEKLIVKREECVASHQTNKIYKLHPDGRVEYEQVCDKMGVVTHDEQWADFQVAKRYLPHLKKGVRISVTKGALVATWPTGKALLPNWILGATLR